MADQNPSVKDSSCVNEVDVELAEKVTNLRINKETNVPSPFTTFESTGFPEEYITKFYDLGFKEPTPIQAQSWPIAMQGKDIIVVAKKGSERPHGACAVRYYPVLVSVGDDICDNVDESSAANALLPRELSPPPGKKLLVLTVKGVLADIIPRVYRYSYQADFQYSGKLVFKRPFCDDFLKFCFANFEVGLWSSSYMYNLEKVVNYLFGDLKNKLLFCWDQSKSTLTNLKTKDNPNRPVIFKELKKLWENEGLHVPWQKGRFIEANTLLIDNSPYKAFRNPPFTAIFPNPYDFKNKEDKSLDVEGDLRLYLEKVATAEDVRCYVKDNPFGQPAITESHPEWKYYLPALKSLRNR